MAAAPPTSFVLSPRNFDLISRFSHLKPRSMLASSNTPKHLMLSTKNDKRTGSSKCLSVSCPVVEDIDEKIGVLLFNHGGPDTLQEVQPYLFNLFADPDIVRLPRWLKFLQHPLAQYISVLRAPKSIEGYAAIGGGSPLLKITDEQANALKAALKAMEVRANVYVAMRYWNPSIEEAVYQIKRDKITRLVALPLYPQSSISTAHSSIRFLQEKFRDDSYLSRLPVATIHSWYQRKGYIKSMADLIEKELQTFPTPEETMIFFSANGVPLSYVENAGDPYKYQMENCISLIVEELKSRGTLNDHTLAYQSRVGPVQWLKPYADEVLVELGQRGVKSLLVVPVSFVSECSKTLHGIDVELKELALKSGIVNWGRVPALNCTETFIDVLVKATIKALPLAMPTSHSVIASKEGGNNPRRHPGVLFGLTGLVIWRALNNDLSPEIIKSWISTGSLFIVLRLKSVSKTYFTGLIDGLIKMGLLFLTGNAILALKHFVPEDLMRKVKSALKDHLSPEDYTAL